MSTNIRSESPTAERAKSIGRRIHAIFRARNQEFYQDKAGLSWNIPMPVLMVFGFVFIFGD